MLRAGLQSERCTQTLFAAQGESEELPFADATFDRILVIDAFHHLRDQKLAAREMVRVLAPGGRLVIQEPDIAHLGVKLVALGEKMLLMRSHFHTPAAVGEMLRRDSRVATVRVEPVSKSASGVTAWIVVDKG
jgi:demethylmenaquinone methyltransferase/2-methoxy-6-polyprenyl-1,4-benzoquinol methylase